MARSLFEQSDKQYFRSGKQCREQWLNHLDPEKKRGEWDSSEDALIVSFILKHGKKWAIISKELDGKRTEHMVKNRYKSIIITLRKKYPQLDNEEDLLRAFTSKQQNSPEQAEERVAPEQRERGQMREESGMDVAGLPVVMESPEEARENM